MKRRLSMSMYRSELTDSLAVIYHIASTSVSSLQKFCTLRSKLIVERNNATGI